MNAPVNLDTIPEWNLADLYAGRDDPKIEIDLAAAKAANDELVKMKGRFTSLRGDPLHLGELLDHGINLYETATNGLWGVGAYASLAASTARDDAAWAKFEGDLRARSSQIAADSLYFTLELNQLEDNEIEMAFKAHPPAARWRPWMRRVRLSRPHELSADLERILIDRGPAVANWTRLYDETLARLTAKVGREQLTLPETLNRLSDPDATRRKQAAQGLAKALEERTPTLALAMNTLAFEKQVEDRWRKYPTPAASRHLANEVDADAVEALEAAVVEAYPSVSHRYYALKAKVMGRKTLDYWDRNAPLDTAQPRTYGWDEAKGMVLESFSDLAPKFADTARTFFNEPWIDARPRAGKQSGARARSRRPPDPVQPARHPLGRHPADPGRNRLDLRRGPGVRTAAGRRVQAGAHGPAGREDRGRPQHRRPSDRLPPLRNPVPRHAPGG
jgi:oligoendopeptidase F